MRNEFAECFCNGFLVAECFYCIINGFAECFYCSAFLNAIYVMYFAELLIFIDGFHAYSYYTG